MTDGFRVSSIAFAFRLRLGDRGRGTTKMRIMGIVALGAALAGCAVASAPARACDDGHWIDEVLADGQILKLEDGSLWKVDPTDTLTSSLWPRFRTSLFATTKIVKRQRC